MKNTLVLKTTEELQSWRAGLESGVTVGFVPTMGALHEGHGQLLRRARSQSDQVVLSVFVNSPQFNDPLDFEKYPRTFAQDLELAKSLGVDVLFMPSAEDIYPDAFRFQIDEKDLSHELCGLMRPGHFTGVLTVVMKLFQLVQPTFSFFGEKDFQQVLLVEKMTEAFFLKTQIVRVETQRDSSGLALSSRNSRLSEAGLSRARQLNQIVRSEVEISNVISKLLKVGFDVEYVVDAHERRFVAAHIEDVRLIDNYPWPNAVTSSPMPPQAWICVSFGGTQETIDSVRRLSNLSSGSTGVLLVEQFLKMGFSVLALKPESQMVNWSVSSALAMKSERFKVVHFTDAASLMSEMKTHLQKMHFKAVVHLAAVSDFSVSQVSPGPRESQNSKSLSRSELAVTKLSSDYESMTLHLTKNPKLLKHLRDWSANPKIEVVGFKLIDDLPQGQAQKSVQKLFSYGSVDRVVYNSIQDYKSGLRRPYRIYDRDMSYQQRTGPIALAFELASKWCWPQKGDPK